MLKLSIKTVGTSKGSSYYFDSNDDGHSSGFHWYRENPDGTWSHKSGQFFVSDKDYADEDGNRRVITDPLVCNRICRDNEEF